MIRKYKIGEKNSEEFFHKWKRNKEGKKELFSSEEVRNHVLGYIKANDWSLIKANFGIYSTNCSFLSTPAPDSDVSSNPNNFYRRHLDIKIKPSISLDYLLLDKGGRK